MASIITITFLSRPDTDDSITLSDPLFLGSSQTSVFKHQRLAYGQVTIVTNPEIQANLYLGAFTVDHNAGGVFLIGRVGNVITITTDQNNVFDNFVINGDFATATVENTENPLPLEIISITYLPALENQCGNVRIRIEANQEFIAISQPIIDTVFNDFEEFDYQRGVNYPIRISNGIEQLSISAPQNRTPDIINEVQIGFIDQGTPQGTIITVTYAGNLTNNALTYSLDGITYQTSPVFSNLLAGTYSVFVKDLYECVRVVSFTIGALEPGQQTARPFFEIPKSNPVYFVRNIQLTPCENKNVDSNISQAQGYGVNYEYLQPYKNCDGLITIQLKSSFSDVAAVIKDCDGNVIENLDVIVKSDNINVFESRDAFKFIDENGFIRVYFTSGQTYDVNGNTLNQPFTLNGNYPIAYNIGSYIRIDDVWELITNIVFNVSLNRFELVTTEQPNAPFADTSVIASTYYNVQDYNIYEVILNTDLITNIYQIEITADNGGQKWVSEIIEIYEHDNDVLPNHIITYASTINNEIVYNTGFIGKLRVPYDIKPIYNPTDELDNYQTDTRLIQLDSRVYDQYVFNFFAIPMNVVKQLKRIFANDVIFIDSIQYKKVSSEEIEALGSSNLYKVKVTLQQEGVFSYVADSYNPYELQQGVNFAFGNYIVDGLGNFIDSNGLVIEN